MATAMALADFQEHLGDVLARVAKGEEILVEDAGKATFRIVPERVLPLKPRVGGQNFLGITYMAPDLFDPMTEEELAEWGI